MKLIRQFSLLLASLTGVLVLSILVSGCTRLQDGPEGFAAAHLQQVQSVPSFKPADPAHWFAKLEPSSLHPGENGQVVVSADFPTGWHIYGLKEPANGPIATQIKLVSPSVLQRGGDVIQPPTDHILDTGFEMQIDDFPHPVAFGLPVKVASATQPGPVKAQVEILYEICNEHFCLPPKTIRIPVDGSITAGSVRPVYNKPVLTTPVQPAASVSSTNSSTGAAAGASQEDITSRVRKAQQEGLLQFLLLAITAGFLALATPCVFPMIPITVSYFTKQEGAGSGNLAGAVVYCLGIIGTFTGLGLLLAALFGASGIAQFAANPWVNVVIALVFTGLALNLMGFFELALPPALVNSAAGLSGKGGLLGTLLMGLTFTLTSFTCTVPYVGTLLVSTTQGNMLWPAIGMLAFSTAFASPFFLLAMFPRLLAGMPRAGSWLVVVKAFMGFLELAAAIKFLSNADLVWQSHIITRAVFLVVWALIGIASGMYLLGPLRLPHTDKNTPGPGRRTLGVVMLVAGLYCGAAIGGAPLGPFDAYAPPSGYGFQHTTGELSSGGRWGSNFEAAQTTAKAQRKPIFLDFTGYTCTNCRWMEANIFPQADVKEELLHCVLVQLYTDGIGPEFAHNRDLEQKLFQTVALPLYAVTTPEGKPIDAYYGLDRDGADFAHWLKTARLQVQP